VLFPTNRPRQIRFFAFLFLGLFFLFLVLFATYRLLQFRAFQSALDVSDKERLELLGDSVRSSLLKHLDQVGEDPTFLYDLAAEKNLKQIVLVDSDGTLLADSLREIKVKEKISSGKAGAAWRTALNGEVVMETAEGPSGEFVGKIWLPLNGRAAQLVVPLPSRTDPRAGLLLLLMNVFGVMGAGVFGYYFLRLVMIPSPSYFHDAAENPATETGFVIHTFQGLIQQLKEKEQDLERLKGRAEEYAKNVESYNENILQSVTSGVLTFNCERRITTFNAAAGVILRLSPEEVLGRSYEVIFGGNEKIARLLEETVDRGKEVAREECEVELSDGRKIWLGLNTSILRDRNNTTIGATLVFTDLTEMKMLQDQVELKKRLTVMGEMSAWIAHEFRNYMGTILGFSRLLSKKIDPNDSRQEMIKAIMAELSAMERLITELLSYGRKTIIHPAPTALAPVLEELKEQFVSSGSYPNVRWSLSLKESPEISVDPTLIRQAFSNMIQNALEAMQGSGEIHIRMQNRPTGMLEVKIVDTGPGIAPEHIDKIFLPFYTTKEKGTGLGLALVHKIILAHNGQISVESTEGSGTAFSIHLPLHMPPLKIKE
jgi:PAS domain S-box-containing protein